MFECKASLRSVLDPSLLPSSSPVYAFLNICLPLRLAGVMGLPLLSIVALQPQSTWGGLQKGYVKKTVSSKARMLRMPKN